MWLASAAAGSPPRPSCPCWSSCSPSRSRWAGSRRPTTTTCSPSPAHPITVLVLLGFFVVLLVHSAHRFRYTLYDGLQIKAKGLTALACYGGALRSGAVAATVTLAGAPGRQPRGVRARHVAVRTRRLRARSFQARAGAAGSGRPRPHVDALGRGRRRRRARSTKRGSGGSDVIRSRRPCAPTSCLPRQRVDGLVGGQPRGQADHADHVRVVGDVDAVRAPIEWPSSTTGRSPSSRRTSLERPAGVVDRARRRRSSRGAGSAAARCRPRPRRSPGASARCMARERRQDRLRLVDRPRRSAALPPCSISTRPRGGVGGRAAVSEGAAACGHLLGGRHGMVRSRGVDSDGGADRAGWCHGTTS